MFCKNCGTPANPSEQFCKKCGAPFVSATPVTPARTYAVVPTAKRSPWMVVVGIILLVVALSGLIFSFTNDAKFLGKWRVNDIVIPQTGYYNYNYGSQTALQMQSTTFEFGLFHKLSVQTVVNGIPGTVAGSYSLNGNMMTMQIGMDYSSVQTVSFTFLNNNTLIIDGETDTPLIRADSVATYVIMMIASVLLAIVGILLMVFSRKKPKKLAPMMYTPGFAGVAPNPSMGGVRMGAPGAPVPPMGGVNMSTPGAAGAPTPGATPVNPGEVR